MNINKWQHQNVGPTGSMPDGGSVNVNGGITSSDGQDGRFWICISSPREIIEEHGGAVVDGVTFYFTSHEEMQRFLDLLDRSTTLSSHVDLIEAATESVATLEAIKKLVKDVWDDKSESKINKPNRYQILREASNGRP